MKLSSTNRFILSQFFSIFDSSKTNIFSSNRSLFEAETCVLTPNEFIEYYNNFLNIHEFDEHLTNLFDVIKTGKNYYKWGNKTDEEGNSIGFVGFSNHYFFNFFNKIRICKSSSNGIYYLLTKEHSSQIYYVAYKEIENIVKMLVNHFGLDDDNKSFYEVGEMKDQEWEERNWTLETVEVRLIRLRGWFQLYIYPLEEKKSITIKIKDYIKSIFKKRLFLLH